MPSLCQMSQRAHEVTDMPAMPRPQRGTWPRLPLVTFPVSMPMCLSGSSLGFGFSSHFLSLPTPLPLPFLRPSVPSSHLLSLCLPQWCEQNELCRRLQLRDLLVAPLQRLTRYPLLLRNMAKRCQMEDENKGLQTIAEQVDTSICELTAAEPTPVLLPKWSRQEE